MQNDVNFTRQNKVDLVGKAEFNYDWQKCANRRFTDGRTVSLTWLFLGRAEPGYTTGIRS